MRNCVSVNIFHNMESIITVLEIIGTVAFAVSGALIAIEKHMDLLGVATLGVITAVGGGVIRDLILGVTPPLAFRHPQYALVAIGAALLMFLPGVRRTLRGNPKLFDVILHLMDTLGLGVFTVLGISNAMKFAEDPNLFLLVFVGVITGVGGGVLRDVLAGNTPFIFVKHIYACASLAGALVCGLLWGVIPQGAALFAGMIVVIVIRLFSAKYHWNLPKAD